ncbi:MAG: hypothetical protein B7Y90_09045 [Alphaproteobacteria bacterium 32-64-14]|nr:MAG: hypothetical protein B7Y90_09045 [Alphaproteobacteria bacterium 32-64-14]
MDAYIAAFQDYEPADEFSPRKFDDSVLAGREFAFELSKSEWPAQGGFWYGYDAERNQLKLQLSLANARHYQGKKYQPDFQYVPFTYIATVEGIEAGSNAFGVAGTYKVSRHERYGVGIASENAKLGLFPKEGRFIHGSLQKEVSMTPDEARAATQGLKVRLAGTLTIDRKYKSVIACNTDKTKPSFDYPYNENWQECLLSGTFTSVEIVSPSAGVLASWGAKETKR